MNLIKNSSLAVVIGYPDLVSIGNTSINQNGQALEVHRHHHGGLPGAEPRRRGDHERRQRARHARAALSRDDATSSRPPQRARALRASGSFSSPGASLVTPARAGACSPWAAGTLLDWAVLEAVAAPDYAACRALEHAGACWGFVAEKWRLILFGRYPYEAQWRPALATGAILAMLVATALPALWSRRGARWLAAGWVRRLRGLLRADGRRRVRARQGRHRPLGRVAADGDPDADRHRRIGADRHRCWRWRGAPRSRCCARSPSPTSSWCAACR